MSLFQTREWWSIDTSSVEESADNIDLTSKLCICLSSFPSTTGISSDLIIIGALDGTMAVLDAFPISDPETGEIGSGPQNQLLETNLGHPILRVATGNLSSAGGDAKIAVLHPRLLSVYTLQRLNKKGGRDDQLLQDNYALSLLYQHQLERSAYSMTLGNFGQGKRDWICVQSLDGQISVYEQETFSFVRFLPNFCLPGALAYVESSDSLVTANSGFLVQSFKFHVLARADKDSVIKPDWSLSIGEPVHSIQVLRPKGERSTVLVVMGHRTLFALTDSGSLMFSKKFDFRPISSFAFNNEMESVMCVVASGDSNALVVLENTSVRWASSVPFKPVIIARGSFEDREENRLVPALLVLVSASGTVSVCYLGTNPSSSALAPILPGRQLDFEAMDKQMKTINRRIQNLSSKESSERIVEQLSLKCNLHSLQGCQNHFEENQNDEGLLTATILIELKSNTPITNIRVHVEVQQPLAVDQSVFVVPTLSGTCSLLSTVLLESASLTLHSLDLRVTAVYLFNEKTPTVTTTHLRLPLRMAVRPCAAVKEADFKLTIGTNKVALPLTDIFNDMLLDPSQSNALGLSSRLHPSHIVTVLSSKSSQRYRLQSDDLPSLWLILDHLLYRLGMIQHSANDPLVCSYSSSFPMAELFALVDEHFALRAQETLMRSQMSERCTQFRAIQKRLLAKFKDPTPTSLAHLDLLLQTSHAQVERSADDLEAIQGDLRRVGSHLMAIAKLVVKLASLSSHINEEEEHRLSNALAQVINDDQEQGWEEVTDASLTHLLRTSLAKVGKEQHGATPISLSVPKDTAKLKKHVASVLDRIAKGARMLKEEAGETHQGGLATLEEEGEEEALPGKRLGEQTERLRSARAARSRQRILVRRDESPDDNNENENEETEENVIEESKDKDEDESVDVDDLLW